MDKQQKEKDFIDLITALVDDIESAKTQTDDLRLIVLADDIKPIKIQIRNLQSTPEYSEFLQVTSELKKQLDYVSQIKVSQQEYQEHLKLLYELVESIADLNFDLSIKHRISKENEAESHIFRLLDPVIQKHQLLFNKLKEMHPEPLIYSPISNTGIPQIAAQNRTLFSSQKSQSNSLNISSPSSKLDIENSSEFTMHQVPK